MGRYPLGHYDPDPSWREQANCRGVDPDLFFPGKDGNQAEAMALCAECLVRPACLRFALSKHEPGIWGGKSEIERQRMRGRRGGMR